MKNNIYREIPSHSHRKQIPEYSNIFPEIFETQLDDGIRPVMNITFQVTEGCNLNCSYCYQRNKTPSSMSLDTAKKAVDIFLTDEKYCKADKKPACILEFIGGEPLLEIDLIESIYKYFIERCIILNHQWLMHHRISICTNGILFNTDKVQNFIRKYGAVTSLSITIDGQEDIHDSCRKFYDGTGSHHIVESSVHMAQSLFRLPATKVTISPENIKYLSKIIPYFYENFKYTDILANCTFEGPWTIEHGRLFYQELKKISEYCSENDTYDKMYISLFNENLFTPIDYDCKENDKNWCGGCGDMISIGPNGIFYPCLRYMPSSIGDLSKNMELGAIDSGLLSNIKSVELYENLRSITATSQSTETCINCPIASGCGWCSAYNYESNASLNKRSTNICIMHKARALANCLYWNTFYISHQIECVHELYLREEDALTLIDKMEYDRLLNLIEEARRMCL